MMTKTVVFRVDAGKKYGVGHMMRCIALAEACQERGANVTFLSHCDNAVLHKRIIDEGFDLIPVQKPHPDPHDLDYTLELLGQIRIQDSKFRTWLIVDGYHFTSDFQKGVKGSGYKLLVIDDMAHIDHYHADILLNQNIHAPMLNYSCNKDAMLLLGSEYVLLRKEFLKYKNWKREIPDKAKKILVTMGGGDSKNITAKVIQALKLLRENDIEVKIVVGPSNQNIEMLKEELLSAQCTINCIQNTTNMPEYMYWADLAVTAGGSTCWELAFMGLPSLIITASDNQIRIAEELYRAGGAIDLGWYENIAVNQCAKLIKELMEDKKKRMSLSKQAQKLINGNGSVNVMRAMLAGPLKLRKTQENDCELLWRWANDPKARESAFSSENIAWEDHRIWFSSKQNDSNCFQYIALSNGDVPIGQIRFDIKNSIAEIDYSVDKNFRGMGFGKVLLKKGIERFRAEKGNLITFQGRVKKENEASHRSFKNAGFLEVGKKSVDKNDVTHSYIIYRLQFMPTKR
jgi:UDP-2,4-diacetamido-2,4,6-trideoxy-beta-L-altropyranose hydrolase